MIAFPGTYGESVVLDFEVQKFSRRCAASGRELKPGETFFSVLVAVGADVERQDYAAEAWQGPPADAIGWWTAQVPDPRSNRVHWAPNDVMLHYFAQLQEVPTKQDSCYVSALLMIRRRILKLEATSVDDQGQEVLLVYCARNESEYRVPVVTPDASRADQIQKELAELLFARADQERP